MEEVGRVQRDRGVSGVSWSWRCFEVPAGLGGRGLQLKRFVGERGRRSRWERRLTILAHIRAIIEDNKTGPHRFSVSQVRQDEGSEARRGREGGRLEELGRLEPGWSRRWTRSSLDTVGPGP